VRDLFDRRMTDPTAAEVIDALIAATTAANDRRSSGSLTPVESAAPHIAERVLREPEGMNGHFGASNQFGDIARLSLGWWTDATGRKFVRVRGWREHRNRYDVTGHQTEAFNQEERDRHRRPGVWHVDWERVVEVSSGGEPEWVAVCGCGAAGSPVSLAWQHGMCGPCADRIAEFGPAAVSHPPGLLADVSCEPEQVLFTPDGRFIFAAESGLYRVWDAATGALPAQGNGFYSTRAVPATASPDGRFVFIGGRRGSVALLELPGAVKQKEVFPSGEFTGVAWTGRPGELLVQTDEHGLNLVSATDDRVTRCAAAPDSGARLLAGRPDAEAPRAVFAAGHHVSIARVWVDGSLTVAWRFFLGDGPLNRTGAWHAGPQFARFTPDGERLLFVRDTEMELWLPGRSKALLQVEFPQPIRDVVFAPDYEHLFVLSADGIVSVCNPGTLTGVRARLRWHIGPVSGLAVSPDGQTLATAGYEGVKLWPVSRLLSLLG
jgi:WD40 repeat protein